MNYKLLHISDAPTAPHRYDRIGSPIPEDMPCNLVIKSINNSLMITINANVLREALLNNPQETFNLLGIRVEDGLAPVKPVKGKNKTTRKVVKNADGTAIDEEEIKSREDLWG